MREQSKTVIKKLGLLAILVLLAGCAGVIQSNSTTAEPSQFVVNDSAATHEFEVRAGPEAPANWTWPVSVGFQRVRAGNWTETYVFRVRDGDTLQLDLEEGEQYRIVVEDSDGDRRVLGSYTPTERYTDTVLEIGPCCNDTFNNGQ